MTNQNVTFTMRLDTADFQKLFGTMFTPGPQGVGVGGFGTVNLGRGLSIPVPLPVIIVPGNTAGSQANQGTQQQNQLRQQNQSRQQSTFLRQLLEFEAIKHLLNSIVSNSQIANTYLGSMGKMFGAALDLLLIPFIPVFNAIMIGMSMLLKWLITSGTLERIGDAVNRLIKNGEQFINWLQNIWKVIQDKGWVAGITKAIKDIGNFIVSEIKHGVTHPQDILGTLGTVGAGLVGGQLLTTMLGLMLGVPGLARIGPLALTTRAVSAGGGALLSGAGAGAEALGLGSLGSLLLPLLGAGVAGFAGYKGSEYVANKTGLKPGFWQDVLKGASGGAMGGAVLGAAFGAPLFGVTALPGAGLGALGGALVGGGSTALFELSRMLTSNGQQKPGQSGQAAAASITNSGNQNSGNTIHYTQNIYNATNGKELVNEAASTMKNLGYVMMSGAYTGPR